MVELLEARVSKPANGGVALYVHIRGTRDEVMGEAGLAVVRKAALDRGWDPDGRADAGFPSSYGLTTYDRYFHISHCLCHHKYGCENLTKFVVWNGICGEEPNKLGTLLGEA